MTKLLAVAVLAAASSPVLAQPSETIPTKAAPPTYDLGVRVGGYGFRRDGDVRPGEGWTECRMNGFGVFGSRSLTGPMFAEAGIDMYSSADFPIDSMSAMDLPIDRTSGLFSVALGARTQVASWLRGYIQLGGGLELSRVSVPYGDERVRANKAMPEGFFGAGADLRIANRTYIGATFRALVMGTFDYDPDRLDPQQGWVSAPPADEVFDASPGVAAQAQFFVRREI